MTVVRSWRAKLDMETVIRVMARTTLSASQVRQPMYTSSVGRWKKYERELQPLIWVLQDAGILLD